MLALPATNTLFVLIGRSNNISSLRLAEPATQGKSSIPANESHIDFTQGEKLKQMHEWRASQATPANRLRRSAVTPIRTGSRSDCP